MGGMSLLLGTAESFSEKSALARCVFCCTSAIFVVNATLDEGEGLTPSV
jgi:hypothetical protein